MINYDEVTSRLRAVYKANGAVENEECPFFRKASSKDLECLFHVYDFFNHWTSIYINGELECIKDLVIPQHIIDFYQNYEPCEQPYAITKAGINLLGLKGIKEENSSGTGGILLKYKLLTIATTIGGNSVCLDFNQMKEDEPAVVIIDYSEIPLQEEIETYYPKYKDIFDIIHTISSTFSEFLWKYSGDEYEDFEDTYLDDDDD